MVIKFYLCTYLNYNGEHRTTAFQDILIGKEYAAFWPRDAGKRALLVWLRASSHRLFSHVRLSPAGKYCSG